MTKCLIKNYTGDLKGSLGGDQRVPTFTFISLFFIINSSSRKSCQSACISHSHFEKLKYQVPSMSITSLWTGKSLIIASLRLQLAIQCYSSYRCCIPFRWWSLRRTDLRTTILPELPSHFYHPTRVYVISTLSSGQVRCWGTTYPWAPIIKISAILHDGYKNY